LYLANAVADRVRVERLAAGVVVEIDSHAGSSRDLTVVAIDDLVVDAADVVDRRVQEFVVVQEFLSVVDAVVDRADPIGAERADAGRHVVHEPLQGLVSLPSARW